VPSASLPTFYSTRRFPHQSCHVASTRIDTDRILRKLRLRGGLAGPGARSWRWRWCS
jgi:hypothetical protein